MTKEEIRAMIRAKSAEHGTEWFASHGESVQRRVMSLEVLESSPSVCTYLDLPGEVPTRAILEACWRAGRNVCVPARRNDANDYMPALVRDDTPLKEGCFGILEPANPEWVDLNDVSCFLVPGLAFDSRCGRLGRGGGHYDRLLGRVASGDAIKVGLAFDFQLVECVPQDAHDVRMNFVVTETRSIEGG